MDEQHKFLINIINDLFEASNNKTTELEINNIIKQMINTRTFIFPVKKSC